ncbi:DUF1707 SHOCT-like domain-containing protein [Natronosporangium hydrolyticum]|uniref:DUF1707 SHOCT-like domain-containing protein n=1 Tax=Natronosporangium hydrolyticum TaxID=2811111 RepID=UPI001EFA2684|nr:DUF1707 domain-containing protein [Natronosporangium hydrolyticum]
MSEQPHRRFRASDADRDQVAEHVRQAMAEGRLSLAEGEERLAAVYGATYQDELGAFTEDLPPTRPASGAGGGPTAAPGAGASDTPPPGTHSAGAAGGSSADGPQRCGPQLGTVPLLLVTALAGLATGWAVLGGGPGWLAILLGVFALVGIKHRWYAYLRSRGEAGHPHPRWAGRQGWGHHRGWAGHRGAGHQGRAGHQGWAGHRGWAGDRP